MYEPTRAPLIPEHDSFDYAQKRVMLAAMILFASFVIGQVGPIVTQPYGLRSLFVTVPGFLGFYGFVAFFVYRGKNWARILSAVVIAIGCILSAVFFDSTNVFAWLFVVQAVMWALFLYLVFTRPGSAWFQQ